MNLKDFDWNSNVAKNTYDNHINSNLKNKLAHTRLKEYTNIKLDQLNCH